MSPEQEEFREVARKFAHEEMIPLVPHYDRTGEVTTF